ncbi:MAG: hypothetical protein FWE68_02455 [Defluviitaleaceae bacterium]|nr:hypothetical protein [Defluviitaleaceae bacterium]
MYALEFQSTIQKDGSIMVPGEYKKNIGRNVKVILLSNEKYEDDRDAFPGFSAVSIKTKDFKFDREYANER